MLLKERMMNYPFSNSERINVDYILEKQHEIKDYSTKMIADETYTSPSTLIRISKKLGFNGWNDFKMAYLEEVDYINKHFQDIDPNFPFTNQDTIMTIASKIANLHAESAKDTLSLMQHDALQKAVQILRRCKEVRVFAISNLNYVGEEFVFKLNRIQKKASIALVQDLMFHDAAMMETTECAICISYSGETPHILQVATTLKENNVPIIAITSVGNNRLSDMANVTLHISTREKSYSKIGGFVSLESISIVLNTLYSCLFSLNYQANLDYKLKISNRIEITRSIDNTIIAEGLKED
ncbi:MurR/RpiR family transcriptional regulator [Beduini massiliensis]|uniref:MurR/RpiR family transcriptional regulator n=1 Tax=Beduini massiliensis TaxID=1585974 RepID=UPI00059A9E25|nr:MurR/RpiR family transcriptional regulator [Beduini massiliensis]